MRNIEATSQDIKQEVKIFKQMGLQMDNDLIHTTKLVTKWLQDDKVSDLSGHHKDLISKSSSSHQVLENIMGRAEKACVSKTAKGIY